MVVKNADLRSGDPDVISDGELETAAGTPELVDDELETKTQPASSRRRSLLYRPYRIGCNWSVTQLVGGLLIAAICVVAVIWYVPRVASTNRKALTGSVTSSGVLSLNFQNSGVISVIKVTPNETVHAGQVLATLYAPAQGATIAADNAAITATQARLVQLKSDQSIDQADIALANTDADPGAEASAKVQLAADQAGAVSAKAQLASDEAQLQTDRQQLTETEIVAPSAGVVVAANGQPGESVTSSGIRNYSSTAGAESNQGPLFSLLPEGPQSSTSSSTAQSSLPVVTLRVSSAWSVVADVPENAVYSIRSGDPVTVSVPAAGIKSMPGHILEVLPDPVQSSSGLLYQAMVSISGTVPSTPLNGMAANIELSG